MFAEIIKPLQMAHGMFFIVEFSAKGGVTYTRVGEGWETEHEDKSLTAEYSTRKEVDHIGLAKWSRSVINQAYNVMERHCSPTPIGYWVADAGSQKMLEELAQVKEEAEKLNKHARTVGSARRAVVEIYGIQVGNEDEEKTAKRLAQTVRERLESLRTDLVSGNLNAYATSWKRAKNLPKLATGIQSESIVLALEAARESRSALAQAIKGNKAPEAAGKALDLTAIESAIWLFTDSVNGTLAEVVDVDIDKTF